LSARLQKLRNTAKALNKWSQKFIGSAQLQLVVAREVGFQLDQQLDRRSLSSEELTLRTELKVKCLGLASLSHSIACQHSRDLFLMKDDA
jgi:hypothetical protein